MKLGKMYVKKGDNSVAYKFMSTCYYKLPERWTEGVVLYGPNEQVYSMPKSYFKKNFNECPTYMYDIYKGMFDDGGELIGSAEGYFALDAINKWYHNTKDVEKYGKFAIKDGQAFLDGVKISYKKH